MDKVRGIGRRSPRAERPREALPSGERPLAWADVAAPGPQSLDPVPSGRQWIGSAAALYLPVGAVGATDDQRGEVLRLPWSEIGEADWLGETQELRVVSTAPFGSPQPVYSARLLGADRLLQLVRERVTSTVVHTRTVAVTDGMVRVTARRGADHARELSWSVELPAGADPGQARVTREAAAALAAVRSELGLEG